MSPVRAASGEQRVDGRVRRRAVVDTIVAPVSSAAAATFHMIQAVEVYQSKRSPGPTSHVQAERTCGCSSTSAAVPVHDPLGQAGGAGGVDDPQRRLEGQRLERRLLLVGDASAQVSAPLGSSPGSSRGTAIVVRTVGSAGPQLGDDVACGRAPCR